MVHKDLACLLCVNCCCLLIGEALSPWLRLLIWARDVIPTHIALL